jgi:copper chaperone CopZ
MTESTNNHHHAVRVVHRLPHRTRLRVPKAQRDKLSKLSSTLSAVPGVESVQVNHQTGSVLITHDPKPEIVDTFASAIAGAMPDLLFSLCGVEELELGAVGLAAIGPYVQKAIKNLNGTVSYATDDAVDLKTLVPALFFGAGAISLFKNPAKWAAVPSIVFFYYAFDTYWKLNLPHTIEQELKTELDASKRRGKANSV